MSLVKPTRDSSGNLIKNSFTKQITAGDVFRVDVREPGKFQAVSLPFNTTTTFTLPWHYQVGQHQLKVYAFPQIAPFEGRGSLILSSSDWAAVGSPTSYLKYDELTSNTVTVYNTNPTVGCYIVFSIPHTSTPGQFDSKVVVSGQGDNAGIEFLGSGDGIIFTTLNGYRFILRVDDEGNVATQRVT